MGLLRSQRHCNQLTVCRAEAREVGGVSRQYLRLAEALVRASRQWRVQSLSRQHRRAVHYGKVAAESQHRSRQRCQHTRAHRLISASSNRSWALEVDYGSL
jgi:hypothetical protein